MNRSAPVPRSRFGGKMGSMEIFIADACRTPVGKLGGVLAHVRPDDLAAHAITGLLARNPTLDPEGIADVVWGAANQAGEDNRNVGRMAALLAGLPDTVPGVTVNRLCGSGLQRCCRPPMLYRRDGAR